MADQYHRYRGAVAPATTATSSRSPSAWAGVPRARVIDLGLWIAVSTPLLANPLIDERAGVIPQTAGILLALVLIVARRRWPIPALGAGLVGAVLFTALTQRPTALLPVTVVLLFNVAVRYDRTTAIRAGLAGLVTLMACIAILVSGDFFGPELLAGLAWPTLAVALGDAVRSGREAIAAAEDRAVRAEESREVEASRRVIEERLHIARELHDVIAHQIAVINVQAGVAEYLMDDPPADAKTALAIVRTSAQQVLDELTDILGVLRTSDDERSSTDPTPGLDDLPSLVASFERVGLSITLETVGHPNPVSDTAALAVYRTVQETLTNAHKHGDGHAHLRITHQPDALDVAVANRCTEPIDDGPVSGYGLVGMRERVRAAGGEATVERQSDDTFVVHARFPTSRTSETS